MNDRLQKALIEEYPRVFEGQGYLDSRRISKGGIECGDGWFLILWELCAELEPLNVVATQVKEKFGGLRFYIDVLGGMDYAAAHAAVDTAEKRSVETCERCGRPGRQVSPRGWIRTLCEKCRS